MTEAIFGLIGVGVGALITGLSNYYLAHTQERATREREREHRLAEFKIAARMIYSDLRWAEELVRVYLNDRVWWPKHLAPSLESWEHHRHILAPELSWDDWLKLNRAVYTVKHLAESSAPANQEAIPDGVAAKSDQYVGFIEGGIETLRLVAVLAER